MREKARFLVRGTNYHVGGRRYKCAVPYRPTKEGGRAPALRGVIPLRYMVVLLRYVGTLRVCDPPTPGSVKPAP